MEKMTKEAWKPYRPIENLEKKYYIISVEDNDKSLELLFSGQGNKNKDIKITFINLYEGYRLVQELARYRTIRHIVNKYESSFIDNNCLFIIENSSFIEWIVEESYNVLEKQHLIHFSFLSIDYYIDVVAPYCPKIQHIDIV